MALLFLANTAAEVGGNANKVTSTLVRDTNYADEEIRVNTSVSGSDPFNINDFTEVDNIWVHFRLKTSGFSSQFSDGFWMTFRDATGDAVARIEVQDGNFQLRAFGTSTVTGSNIAFSDGVTRTVDINVDLSGSDIVITMYYGSTQQGQVTATKNGQSGVDNVVFDHVDVSASNDGYFVYSEIIVADENTRGLRLATLTPDGDGAESDWNGDFNAVQDPNDGNFLTADTNGDRQSFTLSAYNGVATTSTVRSVVVKSIVTADPNGGPQNYNDFLRLGSTNYDGAASKSADGSRQMTFFDDDPATSLPWDTADFASLESGLLAVT